MSTRNITLALLSGFALTAALSSRAATILNNGDFELGTYTSTVGGFTSNQVPTGWTANAAFDQFPGFNRVVSSVTENGNFALQISNNDNQPLPALTQTLADVSGDTYAVTFYAVDDRPDQDASAYLKVSAGSQSLTVPDTVGSYQSFDFSFTGSGSDVLTIAAQNTPGFFYIDNISVTGQSVSSSVPEPASFIVFCAGLLGLGLMRRRFA